MDKPYDVSTITAIGKLNVPVDLPLFYNALEITDPETYQDSDKNFIIQAEYGNCRTDIFGKGFAQRRAASSKKRFDNQVTIVLRLYDPAAMDLVRPRAKASKSRNKSALNALKRLRRDVVFVNCKLFQNGSVQMTGLKYVDQGVKAIEVLASIVSQTLHTEVVHDAEKYTVQLINSDFNLGMEINREFLHRFIRQNLGVFSSFEPCIHASVSIKYYCGPNACDGSCTCAKPCSGKRLTPQHCKKVTVMVFQSGCVIITGAQTYEQVDEAYQFIHDLISSNVEGVRFLSMSTRKKK
jgi:TATA-box binding protein (TBP) (component of TFIID and TFIIIB)